MGQKIEHIKEYPEMLQNSVTTVFYVGFWLLYLESRLVSNMPHEFLVA